MAEALATAAPATDFSITEPLTWDEICERYPDQWVVLVEIDRGDADHVRRFRSARVVGAGKTRREPLEQSRLLRQRYSGFGHYYTGPITTSIAHLLR